MVRFILAVVLLFAIVAPAFAQQCNANGQGCGRVNSNQQSRVNVDVASQLAAQAQAAALLQAASGSGVNAAIDAQLASLGRRTGVDVDVSVAANSRVSANAGCGARGCGAAGCSRCRLFRGIGARRTEVRVTRERVTNRRLAF